MRIYGLLILFAFAAFSNAADSDLTSKASAPKSDASAEEFFAAGMRYYLNGDYSSAREMFANSKNDKNDMGAISRMYLASIAAYNGEKSAAELFKEALANPPKNEDARFALAEQYGRFALANGDYKGAAEFLKPYSQTKNSDKLASLVDWYRAWALWELGKKDESKALLADVLPHYFRYPNAIGADAFVEAYAENDELAKSVEISKLPTDTPAAAARMAFLEGRDFSQIPQKDISLFCLIVLAEKGVKVDPKILYEKSYEGRDAPFAWRGYLALSEIVFKEGSYAEAENAALQALKLVPSDFQSANPIHMALADALRLQKKYDDARYHYEKIFMNRKTRGEPSAESLYKTGLCWYEQGDWAKAHAYFERVFVAYFNFEYWGSRAYYYDARALYSLGLRRDANATLVEYFRRAKDRKSEIFIQAKQFYDNI